MPLRPTAGRVRLRGRALGEPGPVGREVRGPVIRDRVSHHRAGRMAGAVKLRGCRLRRLWRPRRVSGHSGGGHVHREGLRPAGAIARRTNNAVPRGRALRPTRRRRQVRRRVRKDGRTVV